MPQPLVFTRVIGYFAIHSQPTLTGHVRFDAIAMNEGGNDGPWIGRRKMLVDGRSNKAAARTITPYA